jgi:hypothetical protein
MLRRQSHAQRNGSGSTLRRFGPAFGWGAAIVALVGLAFIVGGPGAPGEGPAATPSATTGGLVAVVFGTALDAVSHEVSDPQEAFSPGDTFAYAAELADPSETGLVLVQVLRRTGSGEVEVQAKSPEGMVPGSRLLYVELPAARLYDAWGAGEYVMRILAPADGPVIAEGRFTLLDPG